MKVVMRWFVVVLWMGLIFTLSAMPSLASPLPAAYDLIVRKLAHLTIYAVLTVLLFRAFRLHVTRATSAWLLTAFVAAVYAGSDEWHQTFVPGREGALRDVGIDTLGIAAACFLTYRVRFQAYLPWNRPVKG